VQTSYGFVIAGGGRVRCVLWPNPRLARRRWDPGSPRGFDSVSHALSASTVARPEVVEPRVGDLPVMRSMPNRKIGRARHGRQRL